MAREKKYRPTLTFVQDTREQWPFAFGALLRASIFQGGTTEVRGLGEGDYAVALEGEVLSIRIERKSHSDLCGVCGYGRDRFERELDRLRAYEYRGLVVEASLNDVLAGHVRSQIPGRTVVASLIAWSVRYGLHVIYAENHRRAAGYTQRILEQYAVDVWLGTEGQDGRQPVV